MPPTSDVEADGTYVVAEVIGADAEAIIASVAGESPAYECRDTYTVFPGPNSNTYTQLVLDSTAWNVTLPPSAIGKGATATGP